MDHTAFAFHTPPFQHQRDAFDASFNKRSYAYIMDPGLGKTKLTLDIARFLFLRNVISGLLVLAPNDVHEQWIKEQVPEHWPPGVPIECLLWRASRSKYEKAIKAACAKPRPGRLYLLAMNHEALANKRGRAIAELFLKTFPSLFALDDSHEFRNPKALRTRAALKLAALAPVRRILTGTLTGGNPFAAYAQFAFLDKRILKCDSYVAFKHQYGIWNRRFGRNSKTGARTEFEELLSYQNLDQLNGLMEPYVYSRHKEQCPDVPPKLPLTVPTHMSSEQRTVYKRLTDEGLALLEQAERGRVTTAPSIAGMEQEEFNLRVDTPSNRVTFQIKLTLLLRLQQVAAGFITDDAGRVHWIHSDLSTCPRYADAARFVEHTLDSTAGKVIIWANYRPALEALPQVLVTKNPLVVHGGVKGEERQRRVDLFKDPASASRILVAHPKTMGTGQNFQVATTVLFFTRSFSMFQRIQAEDRAHRLSSRAPVTVADMVAGNSPTDKKEMSVLRDKRGMMDMLEGFNSASLREMLTAKDEE